MPSELKGQRILAVISGTELFGSERANLEALRALHSRGAEIHVAVSGRVEGGGATGIRARELGFTTFEMPFGSHFAREWMLNDPAYRNRQLKRIWTNGRLLSKKIREIQPTVLMFSTVLSFIFCCSSALLHRIPVIYRIGDAPPADSKFQMFFWKWLIRRANHVVCVSDFILHEVRRHSNKNLDQLTRIYNTPITRTGEPNKRLVRNLQKLKRQTQYLFVGQIGSMKGVDHLVNAFIEINSPEIGCWIVGGSEHSKKFEAELHELIKKSNTKTKIEFFGFCSDPRPHYITTDWVIVPSVYPEPLGNIVQEAAEWKTPSIVSNRGGLPELIQHKIDGMILAEPEKSEIIRAVKWSANRPEIIKEFGGKVETKIRTQLGKHSFQNAWSEVVVTVTQ